MKNTVKAVETWVKSHPYLKDIAALSLAFENMLENCDVITEMPDVEKLKEQFSQGIPLLLTGYDFGVENKSAEILYRICTNKDKNIINALPEKMQGFFDNLTILDMDNCRDLVKAVIEQNEEVVLSMAEKTGLEKEQLNYFVWVSIRKALSGIKEGIEKFISENLWQKGICPVCNSSASTAFFKHTKRGRQRFLHCDHCGTDWAYKRMGCPYCENIDQKKMSIKDSEDEPDMRIDLCHKCNSYIKTYIGENADGIGKEGWASIHLDILMKETGFTQKGSLVEP